MGGHVEIGADYESAALQEVFEETGLAVRKEYLTFLQIVRSKSYDRVTGMTNNVLRAVYAYRYEGKIEDLQTEEGKSLGFEAWPVEKVFLLSEEEKKRFIPAIIQNEALNIFRRIQELR